LDRLSARCGVPGVRLTRLYAFRLASGPFWAARRKAENGPSAGTHPADGYPPRSGARCGVPGVRLARPFTRRLAFGPFWAAWATTGFLQPA